MDQARRRHVLVNREAGQFSGNESGRGRLNLQSAAAEIAIQGEYAGNWRNMPGRPVRNTGNKVRSLRNKASRLEFPGYSEQYRRAVSAGAKDRRRRTFPAWYLADRCKSEAYRRQPILTTWSLVRL